MEFKQDGQGYTIPPTPSSVKTTWTANDSIRLKLSTAASSSRKNLVEEPFYRQRNLEFNNIYFRRTTEDIPEDVACLVADVG